VDMPNIKKNNEQFEFYQTALLNVPIPMSISDDKGKRIDINTAFEDFYKISREKAIGLTIEDTYIPSDTNKIKTAIKKCLIEGYSSCEATTIRSDNKKLPVLLNFKLFEVKRNKYIIATATDISEIKNREEELNFIFENSRAAMVLTDENAKWIKINRAFEKDTGYPREMLLGKTLRNQPFTTEETIKALDKFKKWTIEERTEAQDFIDIPGKKKDGSLFIHSAFQVPFSSGKGVLYTALDVTTKRKAEKEYKKAVEEVIIVSEAIASGDYKHRVETNYELDDVRLTAETLNMVMDYLEKTDIELKDLIKELATPAIEVMEGIVVMPLIGKLTSERALDAMDAILSTLESVRGKIGIIDITGVSNIDSAVADNLIKTMESIKLIGAEALLTGISAKTARNLVRIGIKFDFTTKGTLSEGLEYALSNIKTEKKRKIF
jgi:PAS domain S-box-containing protein